MTTQPMQCAMAEHLPAVDRQKLSRILEIKDAYHQGSLTLAQAQQRMREEVGSVKPYEFALAEQELKTIEDDECRKEDIQAMLNLFQDVMDTSRPQLPDDHPIMCYYRENDALREHLLAVEALACRPLIPNQWYELYDQLAQHRTHLSRKQNQLYPMLERKGFDRPTTTMWLLDNFVRDQVRDARAALERGEEQAFLDMQATVVADLLDLMQKEETVLYPTSLAMITPEEFEQMREGDHEIGFAWISVNPPPHSQAKTPCHSELAEDLAALMQKHGLGHGALLPVTTGELTLEQINLIYQHLPIDISYVDEHELVRFYSDTTHRIFPRSKNVIGREVKNCHPRTSVHVVEEIIEKFRSGQKDSVDFWINKPDLFIYIRYVAVRDATGRFRGVLEMMQDCTRIRKLQGSQTLLSWSQQEESNAPAHSAPSQSKEEIVPEDAANSPITPDTRLKALLEAYPGLKEELPNINPAFRMLQTPLARVMIPKATVATMSERSGEPLESLIAKLEATIKQLKGNTPPTPPAS